MRNTCLDKYIFVRVFVCVYMPELYVYIEVSLRTYMWFLVLVFACIFSYCVDKVIWLLIKMINNKFLYFNSINTIICMFLINAQIYVCVVLTCVCYLVGYMCYICVCAYESLYICKQILKIMCVHTYVTPVIVFWIDNIVCLNHFATGRKDDIPIICECIIGVVYQFANIMYRNIWSGYKSNTLNTCMWYWLAGVLSWWWWYHAYLRLVLKGVKREKIYHYLW